MSRQVVRGWGMSSTLAVYPARAPALTSHAAVSACSRCLNMQVRAMQTVTRQRGLKPEYTGVMISSRHAS